jgi:gas vesicle protein
MTVGGLLGFLVVLIITPLFPADPLVGLPALIGYFSIFGITIGVLIGAVIGIVLDRRSQKRVRTVEAERQVVDAAPDGDAS